MLIGVIAEALLWPNAIREAASAEDQIVGSPVFASAITEAATAADEPTTGIVFAALVDDPASVSDHVDALRGELMAEAAAAADTATVVSVYELDISAAVTASSTEDATTVSVTNNTWNPADKSASVVLSNGDLWAYASAANQGVRGKVPTASKFYFEVTNSGGFAGNTGVATATANLTTISINGIGGAVCNSGTGSIWINNSTSQASLGAIANGDTLCVAVDRTNQRIWFRKNGGIWNNNASADPATNVGGLSISVLFASVPPYPFAGFGVAGVNKNQVANFGASTFAQAIPSGFSNAQL
jgi:hypothetical protein